VDHAEPDPYQLSRRATFTLVGFFLAIAVAAVASMVSLPYVVRQPGPVVNILGDLGGKRLITVSGATTYPTEGALDFTTIRDLGGPGDRLNVWELLWGAVDPGSEVFDEADIYPPGVTGKQVEEESAAQMVDSQQEAIAAAMRALGKPVTERVTIASVAKDAPSASLLRAGDVVVAADGQKVDGAEALRDAVQAHEPGETVALTLDRKGTTVEVDARTRGSDGRTTVGVFLGREFDFPFPVQIEAGRVGGPSAGMMFALGIYDTLTPGALTGGKQVAGTGTISAEGEVGPIGGIRQKVVGARDGGAKWFLAPAANCDDLAREGAVPDGLRVVRVERLAQAIDAVEAIAADKGDSLPSCTG
jgi:PDZ domain-containing protein